jgi:hypothetical protein
MVKSRLSLGMVLCFAGLNMTSTGSGQTSVTAPPGVAPTKLVFAFDGGNAYVFTDDDRRVHIGPVRTVRGASSSDFNPHPMYLRLVRGTVGVHPRLSAQGLSAHPKYPDDSWALTGYDVELCPDGECAKEPSLRRSPDNGTDRLTCGNHSIDDLAYVPDLLAFHPSAHLKADWQSALDGRVVLSVGTFRGAKANNCFVFKRGPIETKRQGLADGVEGVQYEVDVREFIDLVFKKPGSVSPAAAVRVLPKTGKLEMKLGMLVNYEPESIVPDVEVQHFRQFYELLDGVPPKERFALISRPESADDEVSPGSGCPPARFGGSK